jgi:hypothetical protein
MQVLWSRATPTRSACRCRACFRRTTTAVSKRQLKVGDLFTACYSTILGTAVFVDAKAKDERRKEWDRVIAETKAGRPVGALDGVERTITDERHSKDLPQVVRAIWGDVRERESSAPIWDGMSVTNSPSIHHDPVDITLDVHLKQAISKSAKIRQKTRPLEAEEDWPDEADVPENFCEPTSDLFTPREPVLRLHVDKMEEMVSKLVTTLLLRRRQFSTLMDTISSNSDISSRLTEIADRIESLQGDTRLPSYIFNDDRETSIERWRLNSAIEKLFENAAADHSNFDLILAKICYNLLVSASPPNIQTYNILIWSFNRFGMYELSQVVVDSFLYQSKFKPSSETVQLLLDHYSKQKDLAGFRAMVDRMRAVNGDMRIKMRALATLHRWSVQKWATTSKVLQRGPYLMEKTPRDSAIFDSLINGFLEIDMLKAAVRYLRAALHEGMQISSSTLLRLVQACTRVWDYKAGLSVLRLLLGHWEGNSEQIVYNGQARLAVRQLFGLCGVKTSSKPPRPLPVGISQEAVQSLQRHMVIQSLENSIEHCAARILKVQALLGCSTGSAAPDSTTLTNKTVNQALSIFYQFSRDEKLRSANKLANNRAMKDAWPLDVRPWLEAQYERLTTVWQEEYDGVISRYPDLCWSDRLEIISHFRQEKSLPSEHPLYAATRVQWNPLKPPLAKIDAPPLRQTIMCEEKSLTQGASKVQLLSRPKEQRKHSSPRMPVAPLPPSLARTSPTLCLPMAPTHANARLEARGG